MLFKKHFTIIRSAGLTLPEVLLAAVLMTLAILPIIGIFRTGIRGQHAQIKRLTAVQIAQDRMNQCLAESFADLTTESLGSTHNETREGTNYGVSLDIEDGSSLIFHFKERAPVPTADPVDQKVIVGDSFKKITVEVTWTGSAADKTLSYVLKSYKGKITTEKDDPVSE